MLQLFRFFRDEKGLEKTDIYYQAHVRLVSVCSVPSAIQTSSAFIKTIAHPFNMSHIICPSQLKVRGIA